MIYEEVTQAHKNLVTVWLDYQKAFDSVPHSWIIESLELAKVPPAIIKAIEQLMYKWKTQARLNIETDFISYLRSILTPRGHLKPYIVCLISKSITILTKEPRGI